MPTSRLLWWGGLAAVVGGAVLCVPVGTLAHRPDCPLVAGKPEAVPVGDRSILAGATAPAVRIPSPVWLLAAILFLLPLGLAGRDLHTSVQVPALVVVTGRGGQIHWAP
jgi:hypothetical protein